MRRIVADPAAYGLEFSRSRTSPISRRCHRRTDRSAGGRENRRHQQGRTLTRSTRPSIAGRLIRRAYSLAGPGRGRRCLEQTLLSLTPSSACASPLPGEPRRHDRLDRTRNTRPPRNCCRHLNNMDSKEKRSSAPSCWCHRPRSSCRRRPCAPPRWSIVRAGWAGVAARATACTSCVVAIRCSVSLTAWGPMSRRFARLNNMDVGDPIRAARDSCLESAPPPKPLERAAAPPSASNASSASSGARQVTYTVRRGTPSMHRTPAAVTVRDLAGWERHLHGWCDPPGQKLVPSSTGAAEDGDPGGEAGADRRRRNRPFNRLGHCPGHACPRRTARLQPMPTTGFARGRATGAIAGERLTMPLDVTVDEQIRQWPRAHAGMGQLDILVHAVAFAPREAIDGSFNRQTPRARRPHRPRYFQLQLTALAARPPR